MNNPTHTRYDQSTQTEVERYDSLAKSIIVKTPEQRTEVYDAIKEAKNTKARIIAFFKDSKEKAHSAWKAIVSNEKSFTDRLDAFEAAGKKAISQYDVEVSRKAEEERRRLQAIEDERARKERDRLAAEAEKKRKAEQDARERAEAAKRAAEAAEGAERERLYREAKKEEAKAEAARTKAEENIEAATYVIAPTVQVQTPETQKNTGESTRVTWKARIDDILKIPPEYYIKNPKVMDAISCAMNDFARATKGAVIVNGVTFYPEQSISIRK